MIKMPWKLTGAERRLLTSTQLFSLVLVALAIILATYTQPVNAVNDYPSSAPVLIVGQLAQCSDELSWQELIIDAQAQLQGDTASPGHLSSATGVVHVGCSLHLLAAAHQNNEGALESGVTSSWQPGPYQPGQQVHVSGMDALDCLVHGDGSSSGAAQAPYVFLLKSTGSHDGLGGGLQAVEYAQLPSQSDQQPSSSSAAASTLLEAWLGASLPQSCLDALQTAAVPTELPATAAPLRMAAGSDPTGHEDGSTSLSAGATRHLLQETQPSSNASSPSPSPSNASDTGAGSAGAADPSGSTPVTEPSPSPAADVTSPSPTPAPSPAPKQPSRQRGTTSQERAGELDAANSTAPANTTSAASNGTLSTVCALQPETGPCRAAIPRWAFDLATRSCKAFVYGGCDGNANNFQSEQECEEACMDVMTADVAASPEPEAVTPSGPVTTSVEAPRLLAGAQPAISRAAGRSWGEQLLRVGLAGLVGVLAVLLL